MSFILCCTDFIVRRLNKLYFHECKQNFTENHLKTLFKIIFSLSLRFHHINIKSKHDVQYTLFLDQHRFVTIVYTYENSSTFTVEIVYKFVYEMSGIFNRQCDSALDFQCCSNEFEFSKKKNKNFHFFRHFVIYWTQQVCQNLYFTKMLLMCAQGHSHAYQ